MGEEIKRLAKLLITLIIILCFVRLQVGECGHMTIISQILQSGKKKVVLRESYKKPHFGLPVAMYGPMAEEKKLELI